MRETIPGTNLTIDKEDLFNAIGVNETPTEKMDRIVLANNRFEMVNSLLTCLAKECGLPVNADAAKIFQECGRVFHDYNLAMEEFKELRNQGEQIRQNIRKT